MCSKMFRASQRTSHKLHVYRGSTASSGETYSTIYWRPEYSVMNNFGNTVLFLVKNMPTYHGFRTSVNGVLYEGSLVCIS